MLKNFKRLTAKLILVTFMLSVSLGGVIAKSGVTAFADTKETSLVVLGDSISYGMSADKGSGFADLYLKHLIEADGKAKLTNLSVPGNKASDLLNKMPTMDALASADVVVVSIGGNHLLSPVIAAISKAFNVNTSSPTFLTDLVNAIKNDPNAAATMEKLKSIEYLMSLSTDLDAGVASFKSEFPKVVSEIKKQASKAQLYILDLYNPFSANDVLGAGFSSYILSINKIIVDQAETLGYTVVPVSKAFAENVDAVKFNPVAAQLDPHPTNVGHDIISKQLIAVEKPRNIGTENGTTVENKPAVNGLTDEQKQGFLEEIQAAKQQIAAAEKGIAKTGNDLIKLDKDIKALKAKLSKAKTKTEKNKLNLQIAALMAKKKAYTAFNDYNKAIVNKYKMIVGNNQKVLDKYEQTPDSVPLTQEEIDQMTNSKTDADKLIAQKKAAFDKASADAKKAADKAAKAK